MPSEARARRVGDRIREEISEILRREVDDPRLRMVTVTGVVVDREFGYATVYFTTIESDRKQEGLAGVERARALLEGAHEIVLVSDGQEDDDAVGSHEFVPRALRRCLHGATAVLGA